MTAIRDDALVGRHLDGRYLVGERIARGGMASVFHGHDERLDRPVAIKVMHSGLGDDEEFSQRFEREARAAAKLNHRGVVAVFDQGRDGDVTYLVMEYVPGRTLRDVMRDEAPMGPARALSLLAKVLTALSAAHTARLVHRDVKPENVLITPEGEVKVADFGLARAVSAATTATGGTLIGTVSYLAPEIVVNEGADARSDVYACGAVLYEMLTGVKPHTGDSPIQVAYKHVHEDIAAPSERVPALPPYVDALVARATVRDRSQRPQDAGVLLRQVRLVQRALSEGLADDPDLVADLTPRTIGVDDEPTVAVESPPIALRSAFPSPVRCSSTDRRSPRSTRAWPRSRAQWKTSPSDDSCVSLRPSTFESSSGPKDSTLARTGTPVPRPPRLRTSVGVAAGSHVWPMAAQRSSSRSLAVPGAARPERSPLTSGATTGTPCAASCSASTCRVRVLPVPVAPATSPCRFVMASGMRTGADGTGCPSSTSTPTSSAAPSNA